MSERFDRLAAWTAERFGATEVAYRWAAQDNSTTDGLPFAGPLHVGARHTYVATGFGGWGMSNGVMAGLLLADLITDRKSPWARLYDPRRLHPLREAARRCACRHRSRPTSSGTGWARSRRTRWTGSPPGRARS
nr:hypothetical protein GCM10020093_024850 [Planobispora longispora]